MKTLVLGALLALGVPVTLAAQQGAAPLDALLARVVQDSNDAELRYEAAMALWGRRRYDEAERALAATIAIDPRHARAHLAMGFLPYARRPALWDDVRRRKVPAKWADAVEESARHQRLAYLIDPMVSQRVIGLVTPRRECVSCQSLRMDLDQMYAESRLDELIFAGFDDFQEGRYGSAHDRLTRLIRLLGWEARPERIPDYFLWIRGLCASHVGRHDEAVGDLTTLLDRSLRRERSDSFIPVPLRTNEYRYVLGVLQERAGRPDEAMALYREALEHDLGAFMAHVRLANILEATGKLEEAVQERSRAIAANPEDAGLLVEAATTLARLGRLGPAEDLLAQAAAANPRQESTLLLLGVVQRHRGRVDHARHTLSQFIATAMPAGRRLEVMVAAAERELSEMDQVAAP